jgi:hypothetical protein
VGDLRKRIEKEGSERGSPRLPTETLATYCARHAASVLPDERLVSVGTVLTAALFGPVPVDEASERWARRVVDEACAAYPKGWMKEAARRAEEAGRDAPVAVG